MIKKHIISAALAGGLAVVAASAFAHHGEEYIVSSCDMNEENTARMSVTTVGIYGHLPAIEQTVQKRHTSEEHSAISPGYVQDLVEEFQRTLDQLAVEENYPPIYFDFSHPREDQGGPVTPGCN